MAEDVATEHQPETAHLRSDYYGPKESTTAACGVALTGGDVFAHPDDVTCPDCLRTPPASSTPEEAR